MTRPLVLVFDDDLVHQPDFLSACRAQFIYRPDADDAVLDVLSTSPHLVLMDYSMGAALSGAQAVALLRERSDLAALVICAISSDDRCNQYMVMAGADHAITKMALPQRLPALLSQLNIETKAST
jgi:DNA-binding NarL/FixJ family response regulator